MVDRFFELISRRLTTMHGAAIILACSSLASQLLALVRDRIFAHTFGADTTLDIYYASFRVPDVIFVTFASFVSVTVLIPFLVQKSAKGSDEIRKFLNSILTVFSILIVGICAIAFYFMPMIADYSVPGFTGQARDTYITFSRILLLSPILFGFSNLLGSVVQFERKFIISAISPLLYNLGIIIGVIFLYPSFGPNGLVIGVVVGALLHLIVQIPVVSAGGMLPSFSKNIDFSVIKSVAYLSLPRTLALGAQQISILLLIGFATAMHEGSISVFSFAFNLQSVPLSIIGVSYSTAAFPTLAKLFSNGEHDAFVLQVVSAAKHIIFWLLPVTGLFIVLRAHIVRTVLGSGDFDWSDTRLTAAMLAIFCISLLGQSLTMLFTRAYYATGSTLKPLFINIAVTIGTIFLAKILIDVHASDTNFGIYLAKLFRVDDISGTSVLVLPLAFSIGATINALLHWITFDWDFRGFTTRVFGTFLQSMLSAVSTGVIAYVSLFAFENVFDKTTFVGVFLHGFVAGIFGITAGILVLRILGNKELVDISDVLHQRFWRAKPISPSAEEQI